MANPVGLLILDAEKRAKKKAGGHTSEAPCGCRVTVSWFSEHSRSNKIERCTEHEYPRDEKTGKKR
jgi:hypothetical protein